MELAINKAWCAPCGVWCRECMFFESPEGLSCGGCLEERFCRPADQPCEFVACTQEHGIEHCGECDEFPCGRLTSNFQTCIGEGPHTAVFRIGDLAVRARLGTEEWARRKREGTLPWTWVGKLQSDVAAGTERRRFRRGQGSWSVRVSFLPAPEAFGLAQVEAECRNMSPIGMMIRLPDGAREGFVALTRTSRPMEVEGTFPTALGRRPFAGKVVWHNVDRAETDGGIKVGVSLTVSAG